MKHRRKKAILLIVCLVLLAGCSRQVQVEDVAGRTYRYEKEGFGGPFTIQLEEDGSFTYYEGDLSSYIGTGEWSLEGEVVTLREERRDFSFRVEEGQLVFQGEDSGKFDYIAVEDGAKFIQE